MPVPPNPCVRPRLLLCATLLPLLEMSGCSDGLTIGPKVATRYIFVHAGTPATVAEDISVLVMVPNEAPRRVNVGGWKVMPPDHFSVLWQHASEGKEP